MASAKVTLIILYQQCHLQGEKATVCLRAAPLGIPLPGSLPACSPASQDEDSIFEAVSGSVLCLMLQTCA